MFVRKQMYHSRIDRLIDLFHNLSFTFSSTEQNLTTYTEECYSWITHNRSLHKEVCQRNFFVFYLLFRKDTIVYHL